jgi:hypothetical protein
MFQANAHLIHIKCGQTSKVYLPVAARLIWFREQCPQGSIETEMLHLDLNAEFQEEAVVYNQQTRRSEKTIKTGRGIAIFKATVKDGQGGVATGTKSERGVSFPDFIEKSETGAIGRALAALGYGTQFTADEFHESGRVVDSPIARR